MVIVHEDILQGADGEKRRIVMPLAGVISLDSFLDGFAP